MVDEKLKVIGLRVDGLRKLSAIQMKFTDKGLIQFRGKNKQGKTSILDSFEILLKGTKYIAKDMITHGEKKAEIIGRFGDYIVKRVITEKSNRIEIKHKEDGVIAKPQEFLDTLINELTFNPRPFLNKTSEQKLRFMMDFLNIDFTVIDEKIEKVEQERLLTGRVIKNFGELKPVEKVERVSVSELIAKREEIGDRNQDLKTRHEEEKRGELERIRSFNEEQAELQRRKDVYLNDIKLMTERKEELEAELDRVLENLITSQNEYKALQEPEPYFSLDVDMPDPLLDDTADIDIKLGSAEERNLKAEAYGVYLAKKKGKEEEEATYTAYTKKLESYRNVKKMKLRNTKIPIEGLSITEDGLYHDDIHCENWSEAEGLRISAELCLAMKPKLSALFLDDGETFDSDSMEELRKWAENNDIQFFLSIVDSLEGESTDDTFYIVEGSVV